MRLLSISTIILVSCPVNDLFEAVEADEEECLQPTDEQRQDAIDLAAAFEPMRSAAPAWWTMHGARNVARRSLLEPLHLGPELDLPEDLPMTFVGEGTYELEAEWGRATLRLREPSNTGALVPHDIFDPDSYLVGAVKMVDLEGGTVTLDYDAHGPLVAWLGFGDAPPRPLVLTLDEASEAPAPLQLSMRFDIDVDGVVGALEAHYDFTTGWQSIEENGPLRLEPTAEGPSFSRGGEPIPVSGWGVVTDGRYDTQRASGGFELDLGDDACE